jgi:nitroreductase
VETWDALRSRRNVRAYADRPILDEDLDRILEAARRAPSSMNRQPWDLVVVTGRDDLVRLAGVWRYGGHIAAGAAAIAFVGEASHDPEQRETIAFDMGQAAMSAMVAAADLGIGSCHSAVGDQALARELLGLPDHREAVIVLSFGYPAGRSLAPVGEPDRRPFDDVVHRGRW